VFTQEMSEDYVQQKDVFYGLHNRTGVHLLSVLSDEMEKPHRMASTLLRPTTFGRHAAPVMASSVSTGRVPGSVLVTRVCTCQKETLRTGNR
jgi:hypothetical protein